MLRGLSIAAFFGVLAIGCGSFGYEVVRVHGGRPRAERFVSDEAYSASLEAAIAEETGDWVAAVEALRKARDEDPDAPDLQARLGLALCHVGKLEAAHFAFEDALRSGDQAERVFTSRASCYLLSGNVAAARHDLARAIANDPEALEPALILVELDLREGHLGAARARVEEATIVHPTSGRAFRLFAEVLVRQGEVVLAMNAAKTAMRIDAVEGKHARELVTPLVDAAGVAEWSLAMRGTGSPAAPATIDPNDEHCTKLFAALSTIAAKGSAAEIQAAAEGVRATCPEVEGEATVIEVESIWSPANADVVEAMALGSASSRARRWGARMQLRRVPTASLVAKGALPRVEDAETLALQLAAEALELSRVKATDPKALALATVARNLALSEPTVARLVAEVAKRAGKPASDAMRATACSLARTELEKQACVG
jgi:Tfp pilus assembly protein PilF